MNPLSTEAAGQDLAGAGRKSLARTRNPRRNNPPKALDAVCEVLENLTAVMERHGGLLPSCLDLRTHEMPVAAPEPLPGQRAWDRAFPGCNLMHDMPLLRVLIDLGGSHRWRGFRTAADGYLDAFLARCTATATGLFPWGEHAFWNLRGERLGDSVKEAWPEAADKLWRDGQREPAWHDHLRQAPVWFWDMVSAKRPAALQRFADGIDRHWVTDERDEYNRHGGIERPVRMGRGERSCDFPRHSGFYVLDLACAWRNERRPETMQQLRRFADYWWSKRHPNGCLRVESRSPAKDVDFFDVLCPSQTLSLGVSLLDAAAVLNPIEPAMAEELHQRGRSYCLSYLQAPHNHPGGMLIGGYHGGTNEVRKVLPVFGSVYGTYPQAQAAVLCCAAFRSLGETGLLDLAAAVARTCAAELGVLRTAPDVPALDAGLAMELVADLHDLTGSEEWLESGRMLWSVIHERYFTNGLVRVATDGNWYEAQQGSGFLLHGAARFAAMEGSGAPVPPDYSAR